MSEVIPQINVAASHFSDWFNAVNQLLTVLGTDIVTANASSDGGLTVGNGYVSGILGGTTVVANTIRGGLVNTSTPLTLTSNLNVVNNSFSIVSGNSVINSTAMSVGANLIVNTTGILVGNSSVNVAISSTQVDIGANVQLQADRLAIGNTTANLLSNSTSYFIANSTFSARLAPGLLTLSNSSYDLHISPAGLDNTAFIQFLNFGNSTANLVANSTYAAISNTSGNVQINSIGVTVQDAVVNALGFFGNSSALLSLGNTTINAVASIASLQIANSTVTTSYGRGGLTIGANVSVNAAAISIGNSSANYNTNSTFLAIANAIWNVSISPSTISIGNSALNCSMNSSTIAIGNSLTGNAQLLFNTCLIQNSTAETFMVSNELRTVDLGSSQLVKVVSQFGGVPVGTLSILSPTTFVISNALFGALVNTSIIQVSNSSAASLMTRGTVQTTGDVLCNSLTTTSTSWNLNKTGAAGPMIATTATAARYNDGNGSNGFVTDSGGTTVMFGSSNFVENKAGSVVFATCVDATGWSAGSDIRLKEDIETAPVLDRLASSDFRAVKFKWKHDGSESFGVIAQEVEKDFPEFISYNEEKDMKNARYAHMSAYALMAIKELNEKVERLESELKSLRS